MDGDNDGAKAQGAAQAGAQGEDVKAAQAQVTGGAEAVESADKAREGFEAALADRDARIAELEGQITEAAKTAESAEKLRAEMDELRRQGDEQRIGFELQMAGCLNLPRFRLHPCAAFRAAPPRCPASNSAGLRFPSAEWILTLS